MKMKTFKEFINESITLNKKRGTVISNTIMSIKDENEKIKFIDSLIDSHVRDVAFVVLGRKKAISKTITGLKKELSGYI